MSAVKLTDEERDARLDARWQIIQAANRRKVRVAPLGVTPRLFGMRQLHRAVFMCRQHRLVKPALLEVAGFRGGAR